MQLFILLSTFFLQIHLVLGLKIATSLQWIEHTPQPYAIKHFYNGSTAATLTSGGVANLGTDKSFDLAANAETQVCEVAYRIVADKRKGITTLKDLKGKKIGSLKGTSAGIFVHNMMSSVGVSDQQYSIVSGNVCMKAPCAADTLPEQFKSGSIDAFGIWEPSVELGVQNLGKNAITFQNASIYREVYSLYSTTDALTDPRRRKDIVEFVRALNKTLDVFANQPKQAGVYDFVAKQVGMDSAVAEDVWADHKWSGRWDGKLINFLVEEDVYLAKEDGRQVTAKAELVKFLDESVIDEL